MPFQHQEEKKVVVHKVKAQPVESKFNFSNQHAGKMINRDKVRYSLKNRSSKRVDPIKAQSSELFQKADEIEYVFLAMDS